VLNDQTGARTACYQVVRAYDAVRDRPCRMRKKSSAREGAPGCGRWDIWLFLASCRGVLLLFLTCGHRNSRIPTTIATACWPPML